MIERRAESRPSLEKATSGVMCQEELYLHCKVD